jgi:hypothetical protein
LVRVVEQKWGTPNRFANHERPNNRSERTRDWEVVATLPDVALAHVPATMIRGEGVPAMVVTDSPLLGEARRSDVRVPPGLRRANWLISQAQFTDAKLTLLATGELGGDDSAEQ